MNHKLSSLTMKNPNRQAAVVAALSFTVLLYTTISSRDWCFSVTS